MSGVGERKAHEAGPRATSIPSPWLPCPVSLVLFLSAISGFPLQRRHVVQEAAFLLFVFARGQASPLDTDRVKKRGWSWTGRCFCQPSVHLTLKAQGAQEASIGSPPLAGHLWAATDGRGGLRVPGRLTARPAIPHLCPTPSSSASFPPGQTLALLRMNV
ncbi:hypothetical protein GN956_G18138 [Arapaima gigas]